jgi:2-dehydro-3-deoxy-D-gluconate 5-dehydrogenase
VGERRFAGRRVLVTGGGRGIGRAVALGFAREGADVVVASRTTEEIEAVAGEITRFGVGALPVTCDVADEQQVGRCLRDMCDHLGGVDVLVNAAGLFAFGPSESFSAAQARELIDTNLLGTFFACREAGRHFLAQGRGKVVNFASLLSFTAFPERTLYAATKGGVLQLTRALAVEWAPRGVMVNAVAPGMIRNGAPHPVVARGWLSEDDIVGRIPAGRRGTPEDVVGAVLFLASTDADYICGQTIVVDGGWLSYGYVSPEPSVTDATRPIPKVRAASSP